MNRRERPDLDQELAALNAAVDAAIEARTKWMDAHMGDYSTLRVGDEMYSLLTGEHLGRVTELYRYWGKQKDPRFDTKMSVDYQFSPVGWPDNCFDNTSRSSIGYWCGTEAEAEEKARDDARWKKWAHHRRQSRRDKKNDSFRW